MLHFDSQYCLYSQPGRKLPRFPASSDALSDVEPDTRELVRAQNKKQKKSGGFQSMGERNSKDMWEACIKSMWNVIDSNTYS